MVNHFFGIRLIAMAAMGLGALYMIHLLAQDYNKIRRPIMAIRSLLRFKRDMNNDQKHENNAVEIQEFQHLKINWRQILNHDPMNCLESLACQLFAGIEAHDIDGRNIKTLLAYGLTQNPPNEIVTAIKIGLKSKKESGKCMKQYPLCIYSASTMLGLLRLFSGFST